VTIQEGIELARADREAGLRQWRVSMYSIHYAGAGFVPAALLENRCPYGPAVELVRHQRGGYCSACDLSWKIKTHREATQRREGGPWVIVYVRAGEVTP